jgi:uncharacterized protein DUF2171
VTYVERDSIQPGWTVWSSDGAELGQVIQVGPDEIKVKKGGLLSSKEMTFPRSAVRETETGRVELDLTKSEAEAGR